MSKRDYERALSILGDVWDVIGGPERRALAWFCFKLFSDGRTQADTGRKSFDAELFDKELEKLDDRFNRRTFGLHRMRVQDTPMS